MISQTDSVSKDGQLSEPLLEKPDKPEPSQAAPRVVYNPSAYGNMTYDPTKPSYLQYMELYAQAYAAQKSME